VVNIDDRSVAVRGRESDIAAAFQYMQESPDGRMLDPFQKRQQRKGAVLKGNSKKNGGGG
jgi:hypothetical protein